MVLIEFDLRWTLRILGERTLIFENSFQIQF